MTQGCGCCRAGAILTDGSVLRYFLLPTSVARSAKHACPQNLLFPRLRSAVGSLVTHLFGVIKPCQQTRVSAVSFLKQNIGDFMVSHALKGNTRGGQRGGSASWR